MFQRLVFPPFFLKSRSWAPGKSVKLCIPYANYLFRRNSSCCGLDTKLGSVISIWFLKRQADSMQLLVFTALQFRTEQCNLERAIEFTLLYTLYWMQYIWRDICILLAPGICYRWKFTNKKSKSTRPDLTLPCWYLKVCMNIYLCI